MNQMSVDGIRISHVASKSRELSKYMADTLDEEWKKMRGMEIQAVGIASVSYDDESKELINMRNKGAMLGDARIREGYVQGSIARGFEAAGSNSAGGGATFMGMGMGMNMAGGFMGQSSMTNQEQMRRDDEQRQAAQQAQQAQTMQQPQAAPAAGLWKCTACGHENTGNFCGECGAKKPEGGGFCSNCGHKFESVKPKFCPQCGTKQE